MINLDDPIQRLKAVAALLILIAGVATARGDTAPDLSHAWAQWRGPMADGVAPAADPPVEWSETKNVRWKTPLPGKGHSSPIVTGDRVFLLAAVPSGEAQAPVFDSAPGVHDSVPVTHRHRFVAMAVARKDGRILGLKTVR